MALRSSQSAKPRDWLWTGVMASSLLATFAMALYFRMYRVYYWGWWIDEFDPYIRYYLAQYTLQHGISWWFQGARFADFWYPWGIDWARVLIPGVSLYGLSVYFLLRPFGFDLWHAVVVAPALYNSLAVFTMYYFVSRFSDKKNALLAAILAAYAPTYLQRGFGGWFDDEALTLFLAPLGLGLLVEALKRRPVLYGLLGTAAIGFIAWTWGAQFYIWNLVGFSALLLAAYAILRTAQGKSPGFSVKNLAISYAIFYFLFAAFESAVLRYGPHMLLSVYNFIPTLGLVATVGLYLAEAYVGLDRSYRILRRVAVPVAVAVAAVAAAIPILAYFHIIGGKFLATILPIGRSAIVQSVAEHTYSTFGIEAVSYGPLVPFIIASVPFLANPYGLGLLAYLVTGSYTAVTEVRLLILLAPAAVAAAAVGMGQLMRVRRFGWAAALLAVISAAVFVGLGWSQATAPQQIVVSATAGPSVPSADWLDALMWMATRLPPNASVAEWWDYGYWVTILGHRPSLADNSTVNSTQIGTIGLAFMSPVNIGEEIFAKDLKTDYVVAFMPWSALCTNPSYKQFGLWSNNVVPLGNATGWFALPFCTLVPEIPAGGDFLKSYWMAQIAYQIYGENVGQFGLPKSYAQHLAEPFGYFFTGTSQTGPFFAVGNQFVIVPLNLTTLLYTMLFNLERVYWMWTPNAYASYGYPTWIFAGVPAVNILTGNETFLPWLQYYFYAKIPPQNQPILGSLCTVNNAGFCYPVAGLNATGFVAASPPPNLKLIYVSHPYGWVVVYEIKS
ncbi:STT3 domain-containing protein [Thermoproteus tenax]|uniref:dolichyl-phosphooligosaccharide-protein glycotransferase n=1 Tax=Thermoproteus tenax (strain ATCC 35583 / DSM 2078 / JCM 9277 / NBRC 100435 / Kra 1) TaxID=768679 RepID=G4RNP0_THETK|nr:STT3 domain-containing protein [Thermoproteus tenax]CCC81184.1 oligosaccharyl transferase stt3 homolog [Thermoproteus tenax Kra 1]